MRLRLMSVEESSSADEDRTGTIAPFFAGPCFPSWNMSSRATCGL
jgi:hypothetical protein